MGIGQPISKSKIVKTHHGAFQYRQQNVLTYIINNLGEVTYI